MFKGQELLDTELLWIAERSTMLLQVPPILRHLRVSPCQCGSIPDTSKGKRNFSKYREFI